MKIINSFPSVLTIAGSDSSGGAGIQADIKAISATGAYAASAITVLTAQNTQGVYSIFPVSPEFLYKQIAVVLDDLTIHAIKIGMLYCQELIEVVEEILNQYLITHVVVDPVMIAKSGDFLLKDSAIEALKNKIFPYASLITPNLPETEKLLGRKILNQNDMELSATELGMLFQTNILIKGGHLPSSKAEDVLFVYDQKSCYWFYDKRIETKNTHGTGCTLSSAIASYLAQNYSLSEAITKAKQFLTSAINASSDYQLGYGHGPVDHFFFLREGDYDI